MKFGPFLFFRLRATAAREVFQFKNVIIMVPNVQIAFKMVIAIWICNQFTFMKGGSTRKLLARSANMFNPALPNPELGYARSLRLNTKINACNNGEDRWWEIPARARSVTRISTISIITKKRKFNLHCQNPCLFVNKMLISKVTIVLCYVKHCSAQ